ncbi:hypothetical protein DM02DRAFT_106580 [Periconia macrospinosa]|uniref:AMP-activated protein kinase glycogen-binding domain-containing protein n=1 Tax=Periconia macrospinosa TaxID=97972 RepID=A0A2V1DF26_9PLEO|nr:hypothetical protein DM02DRAFT_106580 [Periconia macrospinosa]
MAPDTLVTFLFEYPVRARTVELLGSWDNFTKPYQLQRDRRRGHGIWSGCYTFQDIICDGDLENIGGKRNGGLKMGGTYWYYYKVDDEEAHNPSEPTTTTCPLLPGQKLNVLEVPMEPRSRSSSGTFTRNPQDKFLSPVPPKSSVSPRLGDFCKEPYTVPMQPTSAPRSATLPPTSQPSSGGFNRHARSASTSPQMASPTVFCDFMGLKDKFAHKRAVHYRSSSARDLEIGAPTLISTTAEELSLIPLAALQPLPASPHNIASQASPSLPAPITAHMREFAPLRSHPVNDAGFVTPPREAQQATRPRSRSDTATTTTEQTSPKPISIRVQSMDTQRPRLSPGEPRMSSPNPRQPGKHEIASGFTLAPAPVLQRPAVTLAIPPTNARPTSSHGGDRNSSLRKTPLDKDKKLPPLPPFLVPAPLFTGNEALSPKPTLDPEPEPEPEPESATAKPEEKARNIKDSVIDNTEWNSHFSLWSSGSLSSGTSPTIDDDTANSPTLSSLASDFSDLDSPSRISRRSSRESYTISPADKPTVSQGTNDQDVESTSSRFSKLPRLDSIRLSSFGPGLFLDIQYEESGPHRQAACFGYGFQGYKLPEDDSNSKTTITESSLQPGPQIQHGRESSSSEYERLLDEFRFLKGSVV